MKTQLSKPPLTVTVKEAARRLRVNLARVYQLIEEGRVQTVKKDGRPLHVTLVSLETFKGRREWWKKLHGQG